MPRYNLDEIRDVLRVEPVLNKHGVRVHRGRGRCPLPGPCAGKSGESLAVTHDGRRFRCFRCHHAGDVFDLVGALEHLPFAEAVPRCAALAGTRPGSAGSIPTRRVDPERERREQLGKLWRSLTWLRDRLRVVAADADVPDDVRDDALLAAGQCEIALDTILDQDTNAIAQLLSWFSR